MQLIDEHKSFDGWQQRYRHASNTCGCEMVFSVFLPPQAQERAVPVVYWLSGLTCDDQNFVTKAGAQQYAAEHGVALVAPDTSPRGDAVADDDAFDLGQGAGFYVNASQSPWARHYQMYDYIADELPLVLAEHFPKELDLTKEAISGHSMGGHGALVLALRQPERYRAVAAFSPVCAPAQVPWGEKAFGAYLGDDRNQWNQYDATYLLHNSASESLPPIQVEQGLNDGFLAEQLQPEKLEAAAKEVGADVTVNRRESYDHSYFFIASFIEGQLAFLAKQLYRA